MKQVSLFLISIIWALSVQADQNFNANDVTITVNGNKNLQVSVDGNIYNLDNRSAIGKITTIALSNLDLGQHRLQITRTDRSTRKSDKIVILFNLRNGYDMLIKVNEDGSIELIETKRSSIPVNQVLMSNTNFNNLMKRVINQRSINEKRSLIVHAFNKTNNHFATYQVMQLLTLINSENYRIELAKLSYPTILDRGYFNQLYDLIASDAGKSELAAYVDNYNADGNYKAAMSDANFNNLHRTIQRQSLASNQMDLLTKAFNNTSIYFNCNQAKQLIQLVSLESDRLRLAKLSYRSIVDRGNFTQLNDLLSQSSRIDLNAYAEAY